MMDLPVFGLLRKQTPWGISCGILAFVHTVHPGQTLQPCFGGLDLIRSALGSFGGNTYVLQLLQIDCLKLLLNKFAGVYGWIKLPGSLGHCKVTQWSQNLVRCNVTKDS